MSQDRRERCAGEIEGGWNAIKSLFTYSYGDTIPDELKDLSTTVFVASMAGFLFGGMIGARHAGDKYIALNHSTKFTSTMQAQRELHGAALLGFARKGSHWGWRVGLFAGIFSGATLVLSVYRNTEDTFNYIGAGALTGGLFRVTRGIKPLIGGTLLGTLLSIPVGVSMRGLDLLLVGKEQRVIINKNKMEARQIRKERWESKLKATSTLIKDLDDSQKAKGLKAYYKLAKDMDTDGGVSTAVNSIDSKTQVEGLKSSGSLSNKLNDKLTDSTRK